MNVHRFFQLNMSEGDILPIMGGKSAVFSARALDKQTPNEDSAAIIDFDGQAGILVVADGLGGSPAGEQASTLAVRELIASIEQTPTEEATLRTAILNGIENANRAVTELGIGAATTLAVAEIQGRTVRPYHVGDSMILVAGQRGKIKLQTVSHSPVGYAVEAGMLDASEAMHHEERHVVSNILGTPDMRIEVGSTIEMARYDTLLLATDGLFDNLHIEEIIERIRKGPLKRVMRTLVADCRRRMETAEEGQPCKPDDLTFVAFRCGA
ncbi:MAG: serine/threonine-protein phosphatase [Pirellulales bacterium]|nr:serine/threonine-protein phosphatase [Pirellulales bacterium]